MAKHSAELKRAREMSGCTREPGSFQDLPLSRLGIGLYRAVYDGCSNSGSQGSILSSRIRKQK